MTFDIVAIIFVLTITLIMKKRGAVKAILSLTGLILSIFIAVGVYPYISDAVYSTPLPEKVEERIALTLEEEYEKVSWDALDAMPTFIQNAVGGYAEEKINEGSITLSQAVTRLFINVLVFVLVVLITKIILIVLEKMLKLAVKLPVIKQCNSLLGALCGFMVSFGIVWIAAWLLGVLGASNPEIMEFTKDSYTIMLMSNIAPF